MCVVCPQVCSLVPHAGARPVDYCRISFVITLSDRSHTLPSTHHDPNFTAPPADCPNQVPFPPSAPYHYPLPASCESNRSPSDHPTFTAVGGYDPNPAFPFEPETGSPYCPRSPVLCDRNTSLYDPSFAPAHNSDTGRTCLQTLPHNASRPDSDVEMKCSSSSTPDVLRAIREDIHAQREQGVHRDHGTVELKDSMNEFQGAVNELKEEIVSFSKPTSEQIVDSWHSSYVCDINLVTTVEFVVSNTHLFCQMSSRNVANAAALPFMASRNCLLGPHP